MSSVTPRRLLAAAITVAALGATALALPSAAAAATTKPAAPTASKKVSAQTATTGTAVGLLAPSDNQAQALVGSKVTRVGISSGWDQVEPSKDVYNTSLLTALASRIQAMHNAGFQVVLDLGLQYTPSWVFSLPGQTRFVDQYGDAWHGAQSEDVANAVFNEAVRSAQADYIAHLAAAVGTANISAVRVGGLLSGELRYPDSSYNGHSDLIWAYDSAAQAKAPYPGWKPGSGTATQIRASLTYYFAGLTGYESWLMSQVGSGFPGVNQQVMLPGWGLRPGMVDDAVSTGMRNNSVAEVNGMISSGLDWANQVKAIKDSGLPATVYTTWLDAPAQSSTVQGISPVDYLSSLATQYGLPLAGENTGGGGTSALATCVDRAKADHLTSFMYMAGGLIDSGQAGISLSDLGNAAAQLNA